MSTILVKVRTGYTFHTNRGLKYPENGPFKIDDESAEFLKQKWKVERVNPDGSVITNATSEKATTKTETKPETTSAAPPSKEGEASNNTGDDEYDDDDDENEKSMDDSGVDRAIHRRRRLSGSGAGNVTTK